MNNRTLIAGYLLAIAVIMIACSGPGDEEVAQSQYCSMVKEFIDSKGERGWPDYEGTYVESCLVHSTTQKGE